MTLKIQTVRARLRMTVTVRISTNEYRHLFLQPYTPNLKPLLPGVLPEARSSRAEVTALVDGPAVCRAPPRRLALPEVQGSSDQPPWPRDILEMQCAFIG